MRGTLRPRRAQAGRPAGVAPPHPTYLRREGEFVELHHLVHVLCGRKGVTARRPEGRPPPQASPGRPASSGPHRHGPTT